MHFNSLGSLIRPADLARFLRTVRHMRTRQWVYGLRYRLFPIHRPQAIPLTSRDMSFRIREIPRLVTRAFDGVDAFTFLNETLRFEGSWNPVGAGRLWIYNLHYMNWLEDVEPVAREAWMLRWIRENPREAGGIPWEAYPLSIRLANWCAHFCREGKPPPPPILASMGLQAASLEAQLEFHLDANHLLENLLALTHVLLYVDPSDPSAVRAQAQAFRLLRRELEAQILPDGGHFELSPMYHALLLERLLNLLNAWPDAGFHPDLLAFLEGRAAAMLEWMEVMSVGGEISLFNDSAWGQSPPAPTLIAYGAAVLERSAPSARAGLTSLPDSGYFRAERAPWILLFDAGGLGPEHQLGHAHCDMLSACLWHEGRPLLVHPGTPWYVPGEARDYCRSTRAHNTMEVDGTDQAELWSAHRVGRRGHPLYARNRTEGDALILEGAHDAYSHLEGSPVHRRVISLDSAGAVFRDVLESRSTRTAGRLFFHFHPDCRLEGKGRFWRVRLGPSVFSLECDSPLSQEEGWYSPEFGLRIPAPALSVRIGPDPVKTRIRLAVD